MKRIISVSLILAVVLLCFSGCSLSILPSEKIFTDTAGVYITIDSVDESEKNPVLEVTWHNGSDSTVVFGLDYTIEYLDGEEWKKVQIVDFAIPEIACTLDPGKTAVQKYTTKYFNMLRTGTYRIRTEFFLQSNEPERGTTWAEFQQLKQKI